VARSSADADGLEALGWAILLLAGVADLWAASSRGTWLDEFWSLYLADPALPLREAWPRWLSDNHPPLPDLLYRLALWAGGGIAGGRVALNLPPLLGLAAATALFRRASAVRNPFYLVMAVLAVSVPGFATAFSELRSYAWQICAITIVLQLTYFMTADAPNGKARAAMAAGLVAIPFATCLHFVSGLIVSFALALLILHLARTGDRRWVPVAAAAGLGWAATGATLLFQLPRITAVMDYKWITTTTPQALRLFGSAAWRLVLANPLAAWTAIENRQERSGRVFLRLTAVAAAASALILLAVNAARPIVIDRYILAWQLLLAGGVAAIAAPLLARSRSRYAIFFVIAAVTILVSAVRESRRGGWEGTRDRIAQTVRACPGTNVYAITPWRMGPARHSHVAAVESEVFALGYRHMAAEGGFRFDMVPDAMTVLPLSPRCPTLLWVEHAGYGGSPAGVLADAGLRFSGAARLRVLDGTTGFVIAAEPMAAPRPLR
jgi:hypothetical protein